MNNELLAHVTESINGTIGSLSTDLLTFLIVFLIFYFVGVFIGRSALSSLMIAMYPASIIFIAFPYTNNLTFIRNVQNSTVWSGLVIYLVFLLITYIFLSRIIHTGEWHGLKRWLYTILFAFFGVFQAITLGYTVLPFSKIIMLTESWHNFFHMPIAAFVMLVAPLIAVFVLRKY